MPNLGNDIISLEVKVKASDAHAELLKLNKELVDLREELTASGKQSDEFTKDERYRGLIERVNELHGALKKQSKEYGEVFKDNEKTFMELIKARYREENSNIKELEQLRRHLRAKQSGERENTEGFKKTTKELAEVEEKLAKLRGEIANVKREMQFDGSIFQNAKVIGTASMEQLKTAATALKAKLDTLPPATMEYIETSKKLSLVNGRIKELESDYTNLNKKLIDGKQILNGALGYVAGQVVSQGLSVVHKAVGEVIDDTIAYGKSLSELEAITGASGNALKDLEERAASLTTITTQGGGEITNTATDILKAFKLVGSAKPELLENAAAMQSMTREAIIFQKASGLELPEAVQYLTSTMSQFNATADQAGRYINAIAAGAKEGASEIPDISASIKEFGAGAASANFTIEESVALVETLGDKMIKGGEAGTALRNILIAIKAPDALGKEAQNALKAYHVDMSLLRDTTKSGGERLHELSKIVNDASAMVTVFGKENVTAAEVLLRNTKRFDDLTKSVTGTTEAERQATAMTNNLAGDIDTLTKTSKEMITEVGTRGTGAMRSFVQTLTEGVRWIKANIEAFIVVGKVVLNAVEAYIVYNAAIKAGELFHKGLAIATAVSNTVIGIFTGEIKLAAIAMQLFNGVTKLNPLAAIATFFTTAISLAISFVATMKDVISVKEELNEKSLKEKATVEQLIGVLKDEKVSRQTKKEMITKLNELYPDILKNYNLEKADIKELTKLQNELNKAIETRIAAEMRDAAVKDVLIEKVKTQIQIQKLKEIRANSANAPVDEFGNQRFDILDAQIEAAENKLKGFDDEVKKTNETFKGLGYDLDKVMKSSAQAQPKEDTATHDFVKRAKKEKAEIELLAGSVAFLKEQISKLNTEFENTPNSKTPEIAEKLALATRKLVEAESKLDEIRQRALKNAFGRNATETATLDIKGEIKLGKSGYGGAKHYTSDLQVDASASDAKAKAALDIDLDKAMNQAKRDNFLRLEAEKAAKKQKAHERDMELLKAGLDAAKIAADAIFQIQAQNSERQKKTALDALDKEYKGKLDKAKNNTKLTAKLNAEYEAKKIEVEKQAFERQKRMAIAQALINGALAIGAILAVPDFTLGIKTAIQLGLAAAATLANVAVISNQKYAKGGILRGASHAEGGIAAIDTRTGQKVAEMEGDEPYMILSKETYRNNRAVIDALLDASMNGGGHAIMQNGGTLIPNASASSPISTMVFSSQGNTSTVQFDTSRVEAKLDNLLTAFDKFPKDFRGYIVYQDIKDVQDLIKQVQQKAYNI